MFGCSCVCVRLCSFVVRLLFVCCSVVVWLLFGCCLVVVCVLGAPSVIRPDSPQTRVCGSLINSFPVPKVFSDASQVLVRNTKKSDFSNFRR